MKSVLSFGILMSSLLGGCVGVSGQRLSARDSRRVDQDIRAAMSRFHVPGAAVMVIADGHVRFVRSYGTRDLQRRLPVRTDTLFEIGSITKQFTAACILQLKDEGKLKLDDALSVYLPDAPHAKEVTIRNLLTHTSGLHDYLDVPDADFDQLVARPIAYQDLLARLAPLPLDFPPGSKWSYSNTGYLLLGRVIEVVSGEGYNEYLQRHILSPLHLEHTFTMAEEGCLPNLAVGYRYQQGKIEAAPLLDTSWAGSAGFLVSDLDDLSRWDKALQDGTVITKASYREISTAFVTTKNGSAGYGLGLFVDAMYGQPRLGHTGSTQGFTAADEYFPAQKMRVIAFTNSGEKAPEAGETITNILFGDLNPEILANAMKPALGEDQAVTKTVQTAFCELQAGTDYLHFSNHLRERFAATGAKFAAQLSPYGPATAAVYKNTRQLNGDHWYDYIMQFGPGVSIPFSVKTDKDGMVAGLSIW